MSKRKPNKHYAREFKQQVIETIQHEKLSNQETMQRFGITSRTGIPKWEYIYLDEGAEGLYT